MRSLLVSICSAFILTFSVAEAQETTSVEASTWRLVFATDAEGAPVDGSKEALMTAVRAGKSVRVYWARGPVEHLADAAFLTIFEDEVFAQVEPIESQRPQQDPLGVYFREPGVKWRAIIGTNGLFTAFMDGNDEPGVRTIMTRWFVQD